MKSPVVLLFTLLVLTIQAQDKKYPMPDFDNVPYYYDESTNSLKDLEKAAYHIEYKAKGLFGAVQIIVVPGLSSNIRFSDKQSFKFIVHFDDTRTDPSTLCKLLQFTINSKNNNKQREYLIQSQGLGHSETNTKAIDANFKKIGEGLYLITFTGAPPVGEFALTIDKTKQGYAFGIDGDKTTSKYSIGASSSENENKGPHDPLGHAIYERIHKNDSPAQEPTTQQPAATPAPSSNESTADEILKLKKLLDAGAITQQEYDTQKKKLLGE